MKALFLLASAAAVVFVCVPASGVDCVTLQNGLSGYSGTTDAYLHESYKGRNYGGSQSLETYYDIEGVDMNTLLRFDLTGVVPLDRRILSATLKLYYVVDDDLSSGERATIYVHRLVKSWYENIYDDSDVNQGVNWNYADQNETVAWYSGGAMAHGYDVDLNDGNGLATIGRAGESGCWVPGQWVEWNVTNTLKKWYGTRGRTGQYANDGFLMYESMNTGYGGGIFASRNNTSSSPNYKPQLFITWEGDLRPIAEANGAYQVGYNQNVQFSSTGTYDPDCGLITALKWDFNLDNVTDATGSSPSVSYSYLTQTLGLSVGQHVISLRAEDNENDFAYDFANLNVLAVPEPATVTLLASACLAGAALRRRRR